MKVLTLSVISVLFLYIIVFICSHSSPVTALQRRQGGRPRDSPRRRNRDRRKKTTRPVATTVETARVGRNESLEEGLQGAGANCTECELREQKKQLRLDMIKAEILRQLRLDAVPNITKADIPSNLPIFADIERDFNRQHDMASDQPMGDSRYEYDDQPRALVQFAKPLPAHFNITNPNTIYFNMTPNTKIKEALLGLFIRKVNTAQSETVVLIYRFEYNKRRKVVEKDFIQSRNLELSPNNTGKWFTFDLTGTVKSWIRDPETNLGLEITANDMNGNALAVISPSSDEEQKVPYISFDLKKERRGRATEAELQNRRQCSENDVQQYCCKYQLDVDFEALGWHFVLTPRNIRVNYCFGPCQLAFAQVHPHTQVVGISASGATSSRYIGPCCNPVSVSDVVMMYYSSDGAEILVNNVSDIVAQVCGCT